MYRVFLLFALGVGFSGLAETNPTVERICRELIASREAKIRELTEKLNANSGLVQRGLVALQAVTVDLGKEYPSKAPKELIELTKEYNKEFKSLMNLSVQDYEKNQLAEALATLYSARISNQLTKMRNDSGFRSFWTLNKQMQGEKLGPDLLKNISTSSPQCMIKNGRVLACYECNGIREKKGNEACGIYFSLDLTSGEVFGLKDLEDQQAHKKLLSSMGKYFGSGDVTTELENAKRTDNLPSLCQKYLAESTAAEATPAVNQHGATENAGRSSSSTLNDTVKSAVFEARGAEDLVIGTSDTDVGRKRIAEHYASFYSFGSSADPLPEIMSLIRNTSSALDKPEKALLGTTAAHSFKDGSCYNSYSPVKALMTDEVLLVLYPDLAEADGTISLANLRRRAMEVTGAKSVGLRFKHSYFGGELANLQVEMTVTREGKDPLVLANEKQYYLSNYSASGVATSLFAAGKLTGSPLDQNNIRAPGNFKAYGQALAGDLWAELLMRANQEKVDELVKKRNQECEDWVASRDNARLKAAEDSLRGLQ